MTAFISHTTINAVDAFAQARWWSRVLGYADLPDDPNEPGDEECLIHDPETGHLLLFVEVPDAKQVRNRVHLDLRPRVGRRDEEVAALLTLGATEVEDRRDIHGPGSGWVVLADPEGNEFCLLRSEAERQAT